MSYILHVWENPEARSVADANAIVFEQKNKTAQNPRFIAFAKALTAVYPDMHTLEAQGGATEDNVWADSPVNGKTDSSVYSIGITTAHLSEELINFVAHMAADHGLQVFDMQTGLLYRADHSVTDSKGKTRLLLAPHLPQKREPRPLFTFSETEANNYLLENFVKAFAKDGWQLGLEGKNSFWWCVWRQRGEVKQGVAIRTNIHTDMCLISVDFRFYAEPIEETLGKFFPEIAPVLEQRKINRHNNGDHRQFDISVGIEGLFTLAETSQLGMKNGSSSCIVESQAELEAWSERFHQWFLTHAAGRLENVNGIPSLNALLDTEWHRDCTRRMVTHYNPLFNLLMIVYLARSPNLTKWTTNTRQRVTDTLEKNFKNIPEQLIPYVKNDHEMWQRLLKLTDILEELGPAPVKSSTT